ncbi:site-specific integrase [Novilysobacter antarcticus]|uniref:site-specific integrase n=1 Tax=Novilysobacter antarcticus TaxID=2862543 RepID=UPI001C99ADB6|nr:site-specific integrase [Lysobacter antarcticus]
MTNLRTHHQLPGGRALRDIVSQLPPLPSVVRYYDNYADQQRSIRDPSSTKRFSVRANGLVSTLSFDSASEHLAFLLKHAFIYLLAEDLAARTASSYIQAGIRLDASDVGNFLGGGPTKVQSHWVTLSSRALQRDVYLCLKTFLRVLCKYRIGGWNESYLGMISALPLPFLDKYSSVRSGNAFISANDEAAVVRFLNETALRSAKASIDDDDLRDAAMLLCCYQFGMRPIQIAMLTLRDIRVRNDPLEDFRTVHLTFHMVKQRTATATRPLQRRVKREWTPILAQVNLRARASNQDMGAKAFGMKSTTEASLRIASLLSSLVEGRASAVHLRHTAAQRLVDAGASHEELAEFLGHSDTTTALVYYETSANQAERVNKALGISEIYQRVARIAHDRFIGHEELAQLKESQQIGGAPHGVPIAGIGGCTSGQAACPYNPILSCYGCRKFMPIHDVQMHSKVLSDFRGVARFFHDSSRGDAASPAYLQLERTIAEVQAVVAELEGSQS